MKKSFIKVVIVLGIGLLFSYLAYSQFGERELFSSTNLKDVVDHALAGTKGTYGIAIKNLKTQESYYSDEHKIFEAGSLYKIWIMAEAFDQIEKGNLSEDEILSENIAVLNQEFDIDPNYAEMTEGIVTLSVKDAINQMITISHNNAALILTKRIKLSNVKFFLKNHNFTETALGDPPKTTAWEVALFFEKLYKGELANKENTQKMLDVLKRQKLNNKLPKNLPLGVLIAHKTGEIDFLTHDGGIVFLKKGDYIIVVMSKSDSPPGAEERIATISKDIYNYFEKK